MKRGLSSVLYGVLALALVQLFFVGLGWVIQAPQEGLNERAERFALNWVRVQPEPELETLRPPPPPPPPPELTPPEPVQSSQQAPTDAQLSDLNQVSQVGVPALDVELPAAAFPGLNVTQGPQQAMPVHREQPQYPRQALARRIEGWVELVFEVDDQGRVIAESVQVIDAQPEGVFDRAARRAIVRWRFADGELGQQRLLRQRLEFQLDGGHG